MEYVHKLLDKLGTQDLSSKASEANYILFDYKPQDEDQKDLIEKASSNLFYYQIAGVCVGFSLALSLRRYMPTAFEDISFRRCVLDLSLTTAGYVVCSYVGMEVALDNTKNLRKSLIKQRNQEYLTHLHNKFLEFPRIYPNEREVFTEILKDEEYNQWLKENAELQKY